jgi:hypothetical protein
MNHSIESVSPRFDPTCRECQAGLLQAKNAAIGFRCMDHGVMGYEPSALIAELRSACQVALNWAQRVSDELIDGEDCRAAYADDLEQVRNAIAKAGKP